MVTVIQGERVGKFGHVAVGCSASVFNTTKRKMLLVKRIDNGRWAVPGGYMEAGESLTEACAREVFEETGLHVQARRLIAVYSDPHRLLEYPDGNRYQLVVLHFEAEAIDGEVSAGDETSDAGYYSRAEIEQMDIGEFDRRRIGDGFSSQEAALIR